jgi:TolA-binding protein
MPPLRLPSDPRPPRTGGPFVLVLVLAFVLGALRAPAQADAERPAFDAAVRALQSGFADKAARDFEAFQARFPASPLLADAALLEARARLEAGDVGGAIRRLEAGAPVAGALRDQFLFELGRARARQGDVVRAAEAFQTLLDEIPASPAALAAAVGAAQARLQAGDAAAAVAALEPAGGPFQTAAAARPDDPITLTGLLLLADAQLRLGRAAPAAAGLAGLAARPLTPAQAWERQFLLTSLELTNGRPAAAFAASTNLPALARQAGDAPLAARSLLLGGTLLQRLGRADEALRLVEPNLAADAPPDPRRDTLLLLPELGLSPAARTGLVARLDELAAAARNDVNADALGLARAELRLRLEPPPTDAAAIFLAVATNTPPSPLAGRAWLGAGWAALRGEDPAAAAGAFAAAAAGLPQSPAQAVALCKLGDMLLALTNAPAAATNYQRLVADFADDAAVRAALLPRALYQLAVAATLAGDAAAAGEAVRQVVEWFPEAEFREPALSLFGQSLAQLEAPGAARAVLERLLAGGADAPALAEVRLALARSYLREGRWEDAERQLAPLAGAGGPVAARAAFDRAWAAYQRGREAEAHAGFTNLLARFPDDPRAPAAQQWIADHHFRAGDFVAAEAAYQLLFQQTNWPATALTHEARLMAARAAVARQGYRDAKPYLRWLIAHGPPAGTNALLGSNLVAQAYFALGDTFMAEPEGDDRFTDAMTAFAAVIERFPGSDAALPARGRLANAHLQRAELDPAQAAASYTNAAALYREVMDSGADIGTRSQAELGLAAVREKQAALGPPEERARLLDAALDHQLNVLLGGNLRAGEPAAAFWVNRAGLEAARLAEALGRRDVAVRALETLHRTFPAARGALEARLAQLRGGG